MAHSLIFISGEMWFVAAGPVVSTNMILAERTAIVSLRDITVTNSCLHLAVGRHHRRRNSRCPHGLQFGRVKVSFTDPCILAPESTTNSLFSGSLVDAAGSTHSSAGE